MATLISRANGNFTAAGTWAVADEASGAKLVSPLTSYDTNLSTTYSYGVAFTITNAVSITGILLHLHRATLSPTVTFTAALSEDNGVTATREVTLDAADLPVWSQYQRGAWVFLKFATPLTSTGVSTYRVGVKVSANFSFQVGIHYVTSAANWAHMICTAATAAPAAGDSTYVVGEYTAAGASSVFTVTMNNNNTTAFGAMEVGAHGILTFDTTATTNLRLAGMLTIRAPDAVFAMGTPGGTVIPRAFTATLEFACASHGQYGVHVDKGYFRTAGESRSSGKNVVQCKLDANSSVGATSLTVDTDTGWLTGDEVVIASTGLGDYAQTELTTLTGAAGASTLAVAAMTNAHEGVEPTRSEIILLTRNVRVTVTSTFVTFIRNPWGVANGVVDVSWTDFDKIGTAALGKRGFDGEDDGTGLGSVGGVWTIAFCTLRNSNDNAMRFGGGLYMLTMTDSVVYNTVADAISLFNQFQPGGSAALTRVTIIRAGTNLSGVGIFCNNAGVVFNDVTVAAHNNMGVYMNGIQGLPTINGMTVHGTSTGIYVTASNPKNFARRVWSNIKTYRNNTDGVYLEGQIQRLTINTFVSFGQGNANFKFGGTSTSVHDVTVNDGVFNGQSGYPTSYGFNPGAPTATKITFNNCTFGVAGSGGRTTHTRDVRLGNTSISSANQSYLHQIYFNWCKFDSTNKIGDVFGEVSGHVSMAETHVLLQGYQQVLDANEAWIAGSGKRIRNPTVVNAGAAWSEELQFNTIFSVSAARVFESTVRTLEVQGSDVITVQVPVRKSAGYTGSQPRLMLRANPYLGILADTVIDTMTVGTGAWEVLQGILPSPTADGVYELYVEAVSAAGSVYVDQVWSLA